MPKNPLNHSSGIFVWRKNRIDTVQDTPLDHVASVIINADLTTAPRREHYDSHTANRS